MNRRSPLEAKMAASQCFWHQAAARTLQHPQSPQSPLYYLRDPRANPAPVGCCRRDSARPWRSWCDRSNCQNRLRIVEFASAVKQSPVRALTQVSEEVGFTQTPADKPLGSADTARPLGGADFKKAVAQLAATRADDAGRHNVVLAYAWGLSPARLLPSTLIIID